MKQFLYGTILIAFFSQEATARESSRLSSFYWLLGSRQMKMKNGLHTESWDLKNESTLERSSYLGVTGCEKKLLERTQLVFRSNGFYYVPTVTSQNVHQIVFFKKTSFSGSRFIAENLDHDFPKRIIYEMVHADSIHARINDCEDQPVKKSGFYCSRKK